MPSAARAVVLAASTLLAAACNAQPPARPAVASDRWVTVSQNASLRMSLDTARIDRADGLARVWVGFDLAQPWPPIEDIRAPYRHYETRQEVDCAAGRARGLVMRFVDTTGTVYDKPAPDSTWTTFETNPLTPNAFRPICSALASRPRP